MKTNITNEAMTVDIRLCGNIPRDEMKERFGAPRLALVSRSPSLNAGCLAETNGSPTLAKTSTVCDSELAGLIIERSNNMQRCLESRGSSQNAVPVDLLVPSWAVPAKGESRLEPVCESLGRQSSVDLTMKKSFRIGRSPSCDVQLMHATSSRRHAMLFHHSNGSAYIVDCGSAHGTFVNGRRVTAPASNGVIVPFKIRRGSLIRFGGQGAPTFVLKSFSSPLEEIKDDDASLVVRRNTRLNALGRFASGVEDEADECEELEVARKRSFDSLSSAETLDLEPCSKRVRCSSPPLCIEAPLRLVSPDLPSISKPRKVTFSLEIKKFYPAAVTPEESSDEE